MIHELEEDIELIAEITDSKLSQTIRNAADNNDKFKLNFTKVDDNDEWLHLKFNSTSYYLEESDCLQETDEIYYMVFHKNLKHVIFMRSASREFEFKTTAEHHLYISKDDGLGRYKVQTREGEISKQFFVPIDYVVDRYNRSNGFIVDFKKLQDMSDVYSRQTIWCKLQDDAIHLINYTTNELGKDLKQEIDKSLDHHVTSLASSIGNPNNFHEFYDKVIERDEKIRILVTKYDPDYIINIQLETASLLSILRYAWIEKFPACPIRIRSSSFFPSGPGPEGCTI